MIKNIVFDMGKVLVNYDGMNVCRHHIADEKDREQVCTAVFISPEWVLLDMGVIPEDQAMKQICGRLPERLHEAARLCMRDWHLYCMSTMREMEPVVRGLKEHGYGIYLCSNASLRLRQCYRQVIPAVNCFDGILFSAEEKVMKPQKEIYERLFEKYGLKPEECLFIDDLQLNIDGAKACGMDGYCFADRDVERLKEELRKRLAGEEPTAQAGEEPTAQAGEEPAAQAGGEPAAQAGEEPAVLTGTLSGAGSAEEKISGQVV